MKVLVLSGSTRNGSFNTRLARLVAELRADEDVAVRNDLARLPFYDADVEAAGIPEQVLELRAAVAAADLLIVVTPEYNGTVPGVLANAVDWLSRPHGSSVLEDKPVLVLSASPSRFGAVRAAEHLRGVLTRIGAKVTPGGLSVPAAHLRLGPGPVDPDVVRDLQGILEQTIDLGVRSGLDHEVRLVA